MLLLWSIGSAIATTIIAIIIIITTSSCVSSTCTQAVCQTEQPIFKDELKDCPRFNPSLLIDGAEKKDREKRITAALSEGSRGYYVLRDEDERGEDHTQEHGQGFGESHDGFYSLGTNW